MHQYQRLVHPSKQFWNWFCGMAFRAATASTRCTCSHALSVREFLATKQITVLEHPAYSLDLAPSDFFLFPKKKDILKQRHFDDTDDIRSNTTAALTAIPQNQFQNCFEGWTRHWNWCSFPMGVLWRWPWWYSAMNYAALLPRWVRELYCPTTYGTEVRLVTKICPQFATFPYMTRVTNTQMETIHRKTNRKAQVSGRWCKEWAEEDEASEVGRTSTGLP